MSRAAISGFLMQIIGYWLLLLQEWLTRTPVARLDNDTTGISDNQWQKGVQDSWLLQLSNATFLYHFLLNALNLDLTAVKSNYIRRETAEVIYYHLFWMI